MLQTRQNIRKQTNHNLNHNFKLVTLEMPCSFIDTP